MIRSLLIHLYLFTTLATFASTNYYIAPNGNDSNSGTIEAPFKTFQKANDVLTSGDTCYFREGVYREQVVITKSNVTIRNYANENVLISGCDLIDNWQHKDGNLYYKLSSNPIYQVFTNNDRSNIASHPDISPSYFDTSPWADSHTTIDGNNKKVVVFSDDILSREDTIKEELSFYDNFNTAINSSDWTNSSSWSQVTGSDGYMTQNSTSIMLQTDQGSNDHKVEIVFSPEGADHSSIIGDASKEGKSPHVGLLVRGSNSSNGYVIRIAGTMPDSEGEYQAKILGLRLINGNTAGNLLGPAFNSGITLKIGTKYRFAVKIIEYTLKVYLAAENEELHEICSFTDTNKQFPTGKLAGMYLFNFSTAKFYDYNYYSIIDPAKSKNDTWNGGYYLGVNSGWENGSGSNPFRGARGTIDSCNDRTLYLSNSNIIAMGPNKSTGGYGSGVILMHPSALSTAGEWCYYNNTLSYMSDGESPNTKKIEARTRLYAVTMNGINNTALIGINIKAGAISMQNATNCTIDSCSVRYISPFSAYQSHDWEEVSDASRGVYVSGSDNVIKNSYFGASWTACVTLDGIRNTLSNCLLEDGNWIGSRLALVSIHGDYCNVNYNTIRHSTRDGIEAGNGSWINKIGNNITIANNYIYSTNIRHTDGGCIYTNHQKHNLGKLRANTLVKNNYVKVDSEKYGVRYKSKTGALYPDNYSSGYTYCYNLILSSYSAIKSNAFDTASYDNTFYNNTIYDVNKAGEGTGYGCFKELSNNLSNKIINPTPEYDYVSIITQTNRTYTSSNDEFVVGDFMDFRLNDNSPAIDAATEIAGITTSDQPDIGCFEKEQPQWIAGCTFDTPIFDDQPGYSSPDAVPSLINVQKEADDIRITWSDNSSTNEACAIERQEDDGEWFRVGTTLAGVETLLDTYVVTSDTVNYRIRNITGDDFSNISNTIKFIVSETTTSFQQSNISSNIKLYPNPVNNTLFLEFEDASTRLITITDIYGRKVTQLNANMSLKQIDTSELKKGVYLLSVDGKCTKFIK